MYRSIERFFFKQGLFHPWLFRNLLRPVAYMKASGDPERVHELALEALEEHQEVLVGSAGRFNSSKLLVHLKGERVMPFGTAAGLDKNGHVLYPLSQIFGFMEPGTVVLSPREGNPRPRVYVNERVGDIYNAQGFPSGGLDLFEANLRRYRDRGGKAPVFPSICGLPHDTNGVEGSLRELEEIVARLSSMSNGFVWNPFSPNTAVLKDLRTPENFRLTAQLIKTKGTSDQLRLVKMGPVLDENERDWLNLVSAWLEGGGDGIVAVNTLSVPKSAVPAERWGYESAGMSGHCLVEHRQRAIKLFRAYFSDAILVATGGIDSADEAWRAFEAGANAIEGYTPYTFQGFGLLLEFIQGLNGKLAQSGFDSLNDLIESKSKHGVAATRPESSV